MRVTDMTADQLTAAWTPDHNLHLGEPDHPALSMLERYLTLQGSQIEQRLLDMSDEERTELRHQLSRRPRATRTLVERATVVLLVRVGERLARLAPTPLLTGAALVARIEVLGVALAVLKGRPYALRIRDAVRPRFDV